MTLEVIQAVNSLKNALTTDTVLKHPDFSKRFFVQCDESDIGIGAVLFQRNKDG